MGAGDRKGEGHAVGTVPLQEKDTAHESQSQNAKDLLNNLNQRKEFYNEVVKDKSRRVAEEIKEKTNDAVTGLQERTAPMRNKIAAQEEKLSRYVPKHAQMAILGTLLLAILLGALAPRSWFHTPEPKSWHESLTDDLQNQYNSLKRRFSHHTDTTLGAMQDGLGRAQSDANSAYDSAMQGAANTFDKVKDTVTGKAGSANSAVRDKYNSAKTNIKDTTDSATLKAKEMKDQAQHKYEEMSKAPGFLKRWFGSPASWSDAIKARLYGYGGDTAKYKEDLAKDHLLRAMDLAKEAAEIEANTAKSKVYKNLDKIRATAASATGL